MGKTYKDRHDTDYEDDDKYRVIRFKKSKWARVIRKKIDDEDEKDHDT